MIILTIIMRYFIGILALTMFSFGAFFVLTKDSGFEISGNSGINENLSNGDLAPQQKLIDKNSDIEPQKPLANPPKIIKAVYLTGWSAGSNKKIDQIIDLIKNTELNAVVIDIKDYSGYVAYDIDLPEIKKYGAKKQMIFKINSLIKKLHDENIYIIARITVFQDPILAKARPDLAIHSKNKCQILDAKCQMSLSTLWFDRKGLAWIDPAAKEAQDYNIAIAKDAASRGFDELNFDYIRFASDGNLEDMIFPHWQKTVSKKETIKSFFKYLREQLPDVKISADLFGLVTIQNDDLGIGQIIEDAYAYFDYVSPMVYPSHYAIGFLNYKNPAQYPYEVVKYSIESALNRLKIYDLKLKNTTSTNASSTEKNLQSSIFNLQSKLRPWLQDFDLGAKYDATMVKNQIQAIYDAASSTPELINGWMLWNPSNIYTRDALKISE
ncbi:putative glycoside hydrolase [Candidatus Wolfebacteria bacterium]|nr:putative glycoside hydrolase [Candidatus Wolfebacteria bacterium]